MSDEILTKLDGEITAQKEKVSAEIKKLDDLKARRKARKQQLVDARNKAIEDAKKAPEKPAA